MIGVLSCCLFDIAAYLLAFLLGRSFLARYRCFSIDRFRCSSHLIRNSFSSLIWISISLNSGVFITSAFRCFFDDFFQIASPCLLVLFGNKWRTLLSVEGVPSEWLEVEMLEKGFVLGGVDFHFTLVYVLKLFLSDNHLSLSPDQYI